MHDVIRGVAVVAVTLLVSAAASAQQRALPSLPGGQSNETDRAVGHPADGESAPEHNRIAHLAKPRLLALRTLPDRDKLNAGTVTIMTAPIGGAVSTMGSDMASVLDDGETLRVLPILGKGALQNMIDVLRLTKVDMGFATADAVEFIKTEYSVPQIGDRIRYICKVFNIELHIVARKEIKSVFDLAGKKIYAERNFGYYTLRNVLDRLNIKADIDDRTDIAGGLQKVIDGEGDAWAGDIAKVAPLISNVKNENGNLHLVPVPFDRRFTDLYFPSTLSSSEYPKLLASGESVPTVATSISLFVYNWPEGSDRYARVAKFVNALFSKMGELQKPPRHPKWRETFIDAKIPGLQRFKAAEQWIALNMPKQGVGVTNMETAPNGMARSSSDALPKDLQKR
ncbi:MAG: hypothetical protein JOY90_16835 [Bradyrhizobium sp.]|uniref:TAXI family TRAP transporter solute-binding subunit n=1 Tax=Bradyrhizobium sp. TaxID=376 RepID=UPI001DDFBE4A|nr:hypothetical protein [Bradyrhizobium sp.]MBV9562090.1 hypothetical protein [Bradyrhizobium sp.]